MAKKRTTLRDVVHFVKNVDEMTYILTGSRLSKIAKRAIDIYAEDLKKSAKKKLGELWQEAEAALPSDSPYAILHCRPEHNDIVIKARFRLLVRELHPDTGAHPDPKEYQCVVEAYDQIMKQRHPSSKETGGNSSG